MVLQYLINLSVIIFITVTLVYCLLTRVLKRRLAPNGQLKWVCRRATKRCTCWNKRPRELKIEDEEKGREIEIEMEAENENKPENNNDPFKTNHS